ncbi:hypothetical protein HDU96_002511 [Phlyctochytrium bullatum]|nr:hypothetical protein HDU96_002511 [Phlyctochytrium bullatum]
MNLQDPTADARPAPTVPGVAPAFTTPLHQLSAAAAMVAPLPTAAPQPQQQPGAAPRLPSIRAWLAGIPAGKPAPETAGKPPLPAPLPPPPVEGARTVPVPVVEAPPMSVVAPVERHGAGVTLGPEEGEGMETKDEMEVEETGMEVEQVQSGESVVGMEPMAHVEEAAGQIGGQEMKKEEEMKQQTELTVDTGMASSEDRKQRMLEVAGVHFFLFSERPTQSRRLINQNPLGLLFFPKKKKKAFYNDADINVLIFLVAEILDRLTAHNDRIPLDPTHVTRFHSRRAPTITVIDYLRRLVRYGNLSRSTLLALLLYMDRACARCPRFVISSLTVHRFVIAAVTVACKANSDAYYSNRIYADLGGIPLRELNALELELVFMLDWGVGVTSERLQAYYVNLVARHPGFYFAGAR